jgi:hypothetical protein
MVVPDQLKSAVTTPCRYERGITRSYAQWAQPRASASATCSTSTTEPPREHVGWSFAHYGVGVTASSDALKKPKTVPQPSNSYSLFETLQVVAGCVKAREVGAEIWRRHAPARFPRRAFCF